MKMDGYGTIYTQAELKALPQRTRDLLNAASITGDPRDPVEEERNCYCCNRNFTNERHYRTIFWERLNAIPIAGPNTLAITTYECVPCVGKNQYTPI